MSEAQGAASSERAGKGRLKLLLAACVAALVAGGGAFYAVFSGELVLPFVGGASGGDRLAAKDGATGPESPGRFEPGAFVELDPLVISLGAQSRSKHLKITLTVEVEAGREAEVEAVRPRVVDILNGYLRAVDEREFDQPRSMERLRAQMLRRVRLVTPEGAVRDLLVQEFVLN